MSFQLVGKPMYENFRNSSYSRISASKSLTEEKREESMEEKTVINNSYPCRE